MFKKKIECIMLFLFCCLFGLSGCTRGGDGDLLMQVANTDVGTEPETEMETEMETELETKAAVFYVYVCGAVNSPGVYELPEGSRLYEAVDMAGGMTDDADTTYLNMARLITDGEQVTVPTKEEAKQLAEEIKQADDGLVNINTASVSELTTISGIGESRAQAIVSYRESNGNFTCIEDIMKVDGIKDGLFSKIKDKITV
jgi:competence protein ComEA